MKITALLFAILFSASLVAQEFKPSHRLAAELRMEAIRAGESFEDWTAPPADRATFIEQRDARTKARRESLVEAYSKELRQFQADQNRSEQTTLMQHIKRLESELLQLKQDNKQAASESNNTTPQTEQPEAWNAIDTDDGKLIAAGGAAAGASLAGLAGLTFLRRRKQSAETSVDSDSGFDS